MAATTAVAGCGANSDDSEPVSDAEPPIADATVDAFHADAARDAAAPLDATVVEDADAADTQSDAAAPEAAADASSDAAMDAAVDAPCSVVGVFGTHYITSTGHVFATSPGNVGIAVALPDGGAGALLSNVVAGVEGATVNEVWSCALLADTSVWCWYEGGTLAAGELGTGSVTPQPTVANVARAVVMPGDGGLVPLTGVRALMNDGYDTYGRPMCVVMLDGTLRCWGEVMAYEASPEPIINGALDAGAAIPYAVPIFADADGGLFTNVEQISIGAAHACAITSSTPHANDGLYCWGYAINNPLGESDDAGLVVDELYPTRVTRVPATTYASVVTGRQTTCVLASSDGGASQVYCWGLSSDGQAGTGVSGQGGDPCRGDGTGAGRACEDRDPARPVEIGPADGGIPYEAAAPLVGVRSIYAGYLFDCAADDAENLYCWGTSTTGAHFSAYATEQPIAGGFRALTPIGGVNVGYASDAFGYLDDAGAYVLQGSGGPFTCE
jgi:hypothetical protein